MKKQDRISLPLNLLESIFLLLILLSIFLFLSLISFDKNDVFVYPKQSATNLGGKVGAAITHTLFLNLGSVSYFFVFFIFFVGVTGFVFGNFHNTYLKIASSIIMFISLCIVFHLTNFTLFLPHNFYKNIGGGGIIGKVLGDILIYYLGTIGTILVSSYLLAVSAIISTNGLILTGVVKFLKFAYLGTLFLSKKSVILFNNLYQYIYSKLRNRRAQQSKINNMSINQPQYRRETNEVIISKDESVQILPRKDTVEMLQTTEEEVIEEDEDFKSEGTTKTETSKKSKVDYEFPRLELLEDVPEVNLERANIDINEEKEILKNTLTSFDVECKVVGAEKGPSVTTYELELGPGTRLQKVLTVADDIAIALKAPSVRIIAPIPGKSTIGVEVPNVYKDTVTLKELLQNRKKYSNYKLPLFLGKSASGEPIIEDLTDFPHLLIAGTTGSGKSVCINSIIVAFLYLKIPKELRMILIDPKVVELSFYRDIPHLFCPVVTDVNKAKKIFQWLINEMDDRYELYSKIGVKKIEQYNKMKKEEILEILREDGEEEPVVTHPMEYLVVIVDELNDLMMAANREVESAILRLSQKARAVGIHLILATQRPSVDVITGLIKANIPARVAFKVVSKVDSRTILDRMGAEKLLGKGDMLFLKPGSFDLMRIQGCYISEKDIEKVSNHWKQFKIENEESPEIIEVQCENPEYEGFEEKDEEELLEKAIEVVLQSKRGSVSLVQRKLGIGYCRSARLIERMAEMGYLGEHRGAKPREVLITYDEYLRRKKK